MENTIYVLNGTSANLSMSDGKVTITDGTVTIPAFRVIESIAPLGIEEFKQATVKAVTLSFTAGNNVTYQGIVQFMDESQLLKQIRFSYTSDSSGTNAEIQAGLASSFNTNATSAGYGSFFTAAAGSGANEIDITGSATYPVFFTLGLSNLVLETGTNDAMFLLPSATAAQIVTAAATPVFTTASAHGLVAGDLVFVKGWAGSDLSLNGVAQVSATGFMSTVATTGSTTTFTLKNVVNTNTTANTALQAAVTFLKVGQVAMGTASKITSELEANGQSGVTVNSLYAFNRLVIELPVETTLGQNPVQLSRSTAVIYYASALAASPFTAQNAAFKTKLADMIGGGGTDPTTAQLVAI